ncbi:MAG TPA: alpha/beta hydrolase [Acidimicrobiales bacterium]|nr:alpha/beta hydrolase [Acidimicrobiales bacterium]
MSSEKAERVAYGTEAAQFVEVWNAPGRAELTVVFFHGGFWRAQYDLGLMDGLCADSARRGWRAVNVEYRRERGWPAMRDDVVAAWQTATALGGAAPIVTVGHSAGGHLSLWAAASCEPKPAFVVALAGVADLALAHDLGLGGGAVSDLLGDEPALPADPAQLLPMSVPALLVAPRDDHIVPSAIARSYVEAARAAGDTVELIEPPGDHFAVIDPASTAWAETCARIAELIASR